MTTRKPAKKGRPKGSRTKTVATAEACPSRCPKCDSTARDEYFNKREVRYEGIAEDGKPFNTIVIRRTRCRNCGQIRDDRSRELRN